MLTAHEIRRQRNLGNIEIDPWSDANLGPNSYNLTLHPDIIVYPPFQLLDMREENLGMKVSIPDTGFVIQPSYLVLARTVEFTVTKNLIPCIEGRSSLARLGICAHVGAGFGDIGYEGTWTLELVAAVAVKIYPWVQIAQICYSKPEGEIELTYEGKYQGARTVLPSRLHTEA